MTSRNADLSLIEYLQEAEFTPSDKIDGAFDKGCFRFYERNDDITLIAFTGTPGRSAVDYQITFDVNTPSSVIIATLQAVTA